MKYEFDIDFLAEHYPVLINGETYNGSISIGDLLEFKDVTYVIQAINEDGIVVRKL